jgi:outer membrane protein TolC
MSKTTILTLASIILCLSFAATSSAAPPADSGKTLSITVDQSVQLGMENSKSLHESLMKVQQAGAQESEVRTNELPSLTANGSYTRLSPITPFDIVLGRLTYVVVPNILNNYSGRISAQQPLFTGFRLESDKNAAEYSTRASENDYTSDKNQLVYNVKNAYWSLFRAIELEKVVAENIEEVKAHLNDVQNLMDQGMATNNDLLRVQVQLSNTELLQIDAKNNIELAMVGLDNAMGVPLDTRIALQSVPRPLADTTVGQHIGNLDSLIAAAIDNRPDLRALDFRVKASDESVKAAESGWYPQVYLFGDYVDARPNSRYFPEIDMFKDSWDFGVTASWNIWNWGATIDQTNEAQAQRSQAQDALLQLRDGVTLEVTQSYLNLKKTVEQIGVSAEGVKQAQENYRVTNEKFKSGLALNSDVLDAELSLLQAKTNYTQALVDYELANAQLVKSIGQ